MTSHSGTKRSTDRTRKSKPAEQNDKSENISEFVQSLGLLIRRVRAAAGSQELSLTESMVMTRLTKDGPATTADLARAESMRPQSMRTTIAALEKLGMVERLPHPTDGRQVLIQLTSEGIANRKTEKKAKLAWVTQAIETLSVKDRETLFAAGKIIKRLVEL